MCSQFNDAKLGKEKGAAVIILTWLEESEIIEFGDYIIHYTFDASPDHLAGDIDYLSKCNCVVAIPEPVYFYCVNPNSLSKVFRTDRFNKVKKLYKEIIKKLIPIYGEEVSNRRGDRFLIARARTNARQIIRHEKIIGKNKMMKALQNICEDQDMNEIFQRYPIHLLPLKYRLVAYLMKYRCYHLLKIILGR